MTRRTGLLALCLVAAVGLGIFAARQISYDQCQDAGGMIDYAHRLCISEEGARPLRGFVLAVTGVSSLGLLLLVVVLRSALRALGRRCA